MNNINLPNHDSYAYIKSRYYKKPKSKTITKVNGNRLDEIEKEMEYNKSKYEKRIKQLKVITEDVRYIPKDSTDSYHEFIFNMYSALVGGRKITSKM
jgi:uncharacterized protein YxjI